MRNTIFEYLRSQTRFSFVSGCLKPRPSIVATYYIKKILNIREPHSAKSRTKQPATLHLRKKTSPLHSGSASRPLSQNDPHPSHIHPCRSPERSDSLEASCHGRRTRHSPLAVRRPATQTPSPPSLSRVSSTDDGHSGRGASHRGRRRRHSLTGRYPRAPESSTRSRRLPTNPARALEGCQGAGPLRAFSQSSLRGLAGS